MKVKINWADVEVEFKSVYTRWIDKEFQKILFNWVKANTSLVMNANQWVDMNLENIQDANDYLVKAMTNLNEEQIEQLSIDDYNKILAEIEKIKIPSK